MSEIEVQQLCLVGEQAQQLSLLAQKGYPVIPTVVLSATRFRNFLETIHWLQPLFADLPYSSLRLNLEDSQQLQSIARQIRQTIQHAELPEAWLTEIQGAIANFPAFSQPVAVMLRPSIFIQSNPTQSTDELMRLLEPQICWIDKDSLAIGLKQLWAELFRARNLVYWQSAKTELQQIQFAVCIQPIGDAIASGSLQPNVSGWELTATRGLEIAITRGDVLPEVYQIQADQIRLQQAGRQTIAYQIQAGSEPLTRLTIHHTSPILQPTQCEALASLAYRLHTPAALEWQFYGSQLYITQVHHTDPIVNSIAAVPPSGAIITSGLAAAPGTAIAPAYVLTDLHLPESPMPKGAILVTPMILPSWIPFLKHAAALVSEQGGMTSHGAILARELGIPAIVGAPAATERIRTGDTILVNGDTGSVERATQPKSAIAPLMLQRSSCTVNATPLMLNLSQTDVIERAAELEVDGVGLLRSELMLGGTVNAQLSDQIQHFARAFAPRPVFYRSLDLRSHEFQASTSEINPMLGMRGALSYLQDPTSFDLELAALKQAIESGCANLRLILPFVRTVEEFIFCRRRVEQAGLYQTEQFQLWIMAEVPSVLFLLPDYVQAGVQGICIGTSDLTQLILGLDRDQSAMAKSFSETHPAVMAAIAQLIQAAHQLKIPCTISTQAAMNPELVDRLVEWGIDAISVNLSAVEMAHRAIARAEQRLILQGIRAQAAIETHSPR